LLRVDGPGSIDSHDSCDDDDDDDENGDCDCDLGDATALGEFPNNIFDY
jgi:hypothetical protein